MQKNFYVTPEIEVVEMAVESGFEGSTVEAIGFDLTSASYEEESVNW